MEHQLTLVQTTANDGSLSYDVELNETRFTCRSIGEATLLLGPGEEMFTSGRDDRTGE